MYCNLNFFQLKKQIDIKDSLERVQLSDINELKKQFDLNEKKVKLCLKAIFHVFMSPSLSISHFVICIYLPKNLLCSIMQNNINT